jgi:glycosyltransferase involved in cell wall biosynthesis
MPVYNEAANIAAVVEEWIPVLVSLGVIFRLWLIDDGSTDGTQGVVDELRAGANGCIVVVRQANQGHGRACRAGYDAAVEAGAGYVLQVDSDGQCDSADLPRFWALRGDADCMFGRRVERDDGWIRGVISRLCSLAVGLTVGKRVGDVNVPYRLVRGDVLRDALDRIPKPFDMQNVALAVVLTKTPGVRIAHVPIRFRRRLGGESTLSFGRIAALGGKMLRELRWLKS